MYASNLLFEIKKKGHSRWLVENWGDGPFFLMLGCMVSEWLRSRTQVAVERSARQISSIPIVIHTCVRIQVVRSFAASSPVEHSFLFCCFFYLFYSTFYLNIENVTNPHTISSLAIALEWRHIRVHVYATNALLWKEKNQDNTCNEYYNTIIIIILSY